MTVLSSSFIGLLYLPDLLWILVDDKNVIYGLRFNGSD